MGYWYGLVSNMSTLDLFGLKMGSQINFQTYYRFLEEPFIKQWCRKKSVFLKNKKKIFIWIKSPSQTSKYSSAWVTSEAVKVCSSNHLSLEMSIEILSKRSKMMQNHLEVLAASQHKKAGLNYMGTGPCVSLACNDRFAICSLEIKQT